MISGDMKEHCQGIGLTAANIICLSDSFNDTPEEYKKSILYSEKYENKENIRTDIKRCAEKISSAIKEMSIEELEWLNNIYNISLIEYGDRLSNAANCEPYSNSDVRRCTDAILYIAIDIVHGRLQSDDDYKIMLGEENVYG